MREGVVDVVVAFVEVGVVVREEEERLEKSTYLVLDLLGLNWKVSFVSGL